MSFFKVLLCLFLFFYTSKMKIYAEQKAEVKTHEDQYNIWLQKEIPILLSNNSVNCIDTITQIRKYLSNNPLNSDHSINYLASCRLAENLLKENMDHICNKKTHLKMNSLQKLSSQLFTYYLCEKGFK